MSGSPRSSCPASTLVCDPGLGRALFVPVAEASDAFRVPVSALADTCQRMAAFRHIARVGQPVAAAEVETAPGWLDETAPVASRFP